MGIDFADSALPQIDLARCIACGRCAAVCSTGTLALDDHRVSIARRSFMGCIGCGQCMAACQKGAIRVSGRRLSPDDVVPLPPRQAVADEFDGLLLARRSIRRFAAREVEREAVERILAMTSTAPMGIPPTEVGVVVFHGREKVRQFAAEAIASFEKTAARMNPLVLTLMRPFMGKANCQMMREFVVPLFKQFAAEWREGRDHFTYDAPLALLFHRGPLADPADPHIAATYAMLAAQSLGLGSCMLGTTVALDFAGELRTKYGIPKGNKIGLGLAIGHPTAQFTQSIRRQFASVKFM